MEKPLLAEQDSNQTQSQTPPPAPVPKKRKKGIMKKFLVGFMAMVTLLLCGLSVLMQAGNSASVVIAVNSASIATGTNPDGSPFDIYDMLSDDVLQAAAESLQGTISIEQLKARLRVADALPNNVNQKLKQSILNGENENTYFPSVYQLTYTLVPSGDLLELCRSLFLYTFGPDAEQVLTAVVTAYQEYYADRHLKYAALFQIDWNQIADMDYYNRAEALRVEAMRIYRFLHANYDSATKTLESSSGLGYGDLCNALAQIINVHIENHQSYIVQKGLTKNMVELLREFQYMEDLYLKEQERKSEEYAVLQDAVDIYESSTTKVVFIPALDQDNSFYMNRTKVGMDYLIEQASAAKIEADEAEYAAKRYAYLQECFMNSTGATKKMYDHADETFEGIKESLVSLSETVIRLVEEDAIAGNKGIKAGEVYRDVSILSMAMSFAKRSVFALMALYVLYSFCGLMRKNTRKAKREGGK